MGLLICCINPIIDWNCSSLQQSSLQKTVLHMLVLLKAVPNLKRLLNSQLLLVYIEITYVEEIIAFTCHIYMNGGIVKMKGMESILVLLDGTSFEHHGGIKQ